MSICTYKWPVAGDQWPVNAVEKKGLALAWYLKLYVDKSLLTV
jgi:hypothetical protein